MPSLACSHLTGAPAECVYHDEIKDVAIFWEQLKLADKRRFTLISSSDGYGEEACENGIIKGHAYTLLRVFDFKNKGK